ncbi:MAG: hypothetical protein DMF84_12255 [Acidobacteria bacterium]|nr:MAG: hypothetical protein DMF84_12255 [Acidobacteriota bacterium]
MKLPAEGRLLRIFVGEADRWEGRPLYQAIVEAARHQGLAGATAWKGFIGFGANSRVHTAKVLRLSEDLPVVIEIVDGPDKIEAFLPALDEMVQEGLVTLERAKVIHYRHRTKKDGS